MLRKLRFPILLLLLLSIIPLQNMSGGVSRSSRATSGTMEAAFGSKCEDLLIREINKANKTILVAIYSITRKNITKALADAVSRNVHVELKYDLKSSEWPGMKTAIGYMVNRKIKCTPIKFSGGYAKMHHKFVVIDGSRVLTGSYNFTTSATRSNYENLVLLDSDQIAKLFTEEYEKIK